MLREALVFKYLSDLLYSKNIDLVQTNSYFNLSSLLEMKPSKAAARHQKKSENSIENQTVPQPVLTETKHAVSEIWVHPKFVDKRSSLPICNKIKNTQILAASDNYLNVKSVEKRASLQLSDFYSLINCNEYFNSQLSSLFIVGNLKLNSNKTSIGNSKQESRSSYISDVVNINSTATQNSSRNNSYDELQFCLSENITADKNVDEAELSLNGIDLSVAQNDSYDVLFKELPFNIMSKRNGVFKRFFNFMTKKLFKCCK